MSEGAGTRDEGVLFFGGWAGVGGCVCVDRADLTTSSYWRHSTVTASQRKADDELTTWIIINLIK